MMDKIAFKKLKTQDLELLYRWLQEGATLRWYAKKILSFDDVKKKYLPYIKGEVKTNPFLIFYMGQAIGYIQTYRVKDHPNWNAYAGANTHTVGLDLFIGDTKLQGKGLGYKIIREFLKKVAFKDKSISSCIAGPDPRNKASIISFEKAGFKYWKTIHPPEGDEYLMIIDRKKELEKDKKSLANKR